GTAPRRSSEGTIHCTPPYVEKRETDHQPLTPTERPTEDTPPTENTYSHTRQPAAKATLCCCGQSVNNSMRRVIWPGVPAGTFRSTRSVALSPGGMDSGMSCVVIHEQSDVPPINRTGSLE